ncbi:MAG TPA: hypothetical protein VN368_03230 [Candidatus Methylomirabilis sp.]|nr:hypothetical protein [Candidatus Methylomirabilis sp.]
MTSTFVIAILSMHMMVKVFRRYIQFSTTIFWPINNFLPQIPDWEHLFAAAAIFLMFHFFVRYLSKNRFRLIFLMLFGIILVLATNFLQVQGLEGNTILQSKGWETGFVVPITGTSVIGNQYYHDAIKITDAVYFLNNFQQLQPYLLLHARTHPPGAVLIIYLLLKILGNPALVSIVIGIISVSLSTFFLYKILSIEFKEDMSRYMTFLFILIPSIQIFYIATIDALIITFLLGSLYFYLGRKSLINIISSLFFLFMASFLTFTFVFILPIMVGYEMLIRKDFFRSGYMIMGMGLIYTLIGLFFNYNYVTSFMTASALENRHGFMLFSETLTYLFTRIEGTLEIIFYFGPFLSLLMLMGLCTHEKIRSNLLTIAWLAIFSLLAMLGAGVFRTAETARTALFIYPFLLFPVASYLQKSNISLTGRTILLYLVFAQAILMQTFGFYFW